MVNRLIVLTLVALTGQGFAQSRGLGPRAPAMASQRYDIGVQLYTDGRYADAAREFRVAQAVMPDSSHVAFNLARSLERAGDLEASYEVYGRYLELETDETQRGEVELVRAALRKSIDRRPPPESTGDWRPVTGWSAMGAGVAALVVGAVFHAQAADTADRGAALGPGRQDTAADLDDDLKGEQAGMWLGYGLGAILVATGAALLAWPEDEGVVFTPTGGGAVARWTVRW